MHMVLYVYLTWVLLSTPIPKIFLPIIDVTFPRLHDTKGNTTTLNVFFTAHVLPPAPRHSLLTAHMIVFALASFPIQSQQEAKAIANK